MNPNGQKRNAAELISIHRTELMGLAAFLILFFHVWVPVFRSIPVLRQGEGFFKRISFLGVDVFFFLSGMGLPRSMKNHSLGEYYYRRIRRIIFPFICAALLSWPTRGWTVQEFLFAVTGFGFWSESIYYFLWFIPAIFTLYLLFPLYYRFLSSCAHPVCFTAAALGFWLLLAMLGRHLIREDIYGMINRIPVFLIGTMLGELSNRGIAFPLSLPACILSLFLGLYLAYRTNYTGLYLLVPESNCFLPNFLITFSLCPLFSLLMEKLVPVNPIRGFGAFLGGISLELYCVQEWLASLIREPVMLHVSPILANLILFPIIIAAGYGLARLNRLFVKRLDHAVLR